MRARSSSLAALAILAVLFGGCGASDSRSDALPPLKEFGADREYASNEVASELAMATGDVDVVLLATEQSRVTAPGSTSIINAKVFGSTARRAGNEEVNFPTITVRASPEIRFVDLTNSCQLSDDVMVCTSSSSFLKDGGSTETGSITWPISYTIAAGAEGPLTIAIEASSSNVPLDEDPAPSNNTATITIQTS